MVRSKQPPPRQRLTGLAVVLITGFGLYPQAKGQEAYSREQLDFFENRIRPVLVEHCYECHSVEASNSGKLSGELLLDSREALLKGGESGPAVVPGQSEDSLLISALRYEDFEMPPKGKLPEAIIADFKQWIETGAADPRDGAAIVASRKLDFEKGRQFWSFQPLQPAPMGMPDAANVHPVDFLVQTRQKELGLKLSPITIATS
jgi:Planctomycete cytochrome C